jgi:hypothetical protein
MTQLSLQRAIAAVLASLAATATVHAQEAPASPAVADATEVNISGITGNGVQIDLSTDVNTLSSVTQNEGVHRLFLDILRIADVHGLSLGRGMERSAG